MAQTAFIISPIGSPGSEERQWADQVYDTIIKPPLQAENYNTVRADEIGEPGLITNQIVRELLGAHLVVADLTFQNPNVFYELAIRHAAEKPVIHLIRQGEGIPFDINDQRVIKLSPFEDLRTIETSREQIRDQVQAIDGGEFETENPINTAIKLSLLKRQKGDDVTVEGDLLAEITEVKEELRSVKRRLPSKSRGQAVEGSQGTPNRMGLSEFISQEPRGKSKRASDLLLDPPEPPWEESAGEGTRVSDLLEDPPKSPWEQATDETPDPYDEIADKVELSSDKAVEKLTGSDATPTVTADSPSEESEDEGDESG